MKVDTVEREREGGRRGDGRWDVSNVAREVFRDTGWGR